jgi:glycine cleavage system H protein
VQVPEGLRYTENHEWVAVEDGGKVRIGITDFAQDALGDVVFVDLPEEGAEVTAGEAFAEIESTKSVADVYAPVDGTVIAVNESLEHAPEKVNSDPYGEGWFAVMEGDPSKLESLMDAAAYRNFSE